MKKTTDVWFMSYLMLKNVVPIVYNKNKFLIEAEYKIEDNEWDTHKNNYINSDIYRVKFFIRSLKEMGK